MVLKCRHAPTVSATIGSVLSRTTRLVVVPNVFVGASVVTSKALRWVTWILSYMSGPVLTRRRRKQQRSYCACKPNVASLIVVLKTYWCVD